MDKDSKFTKLKKPESSDLQDPLKSLRKNALQCGNISKLQELPERKVRIKLVSATPEC